MPGNKKDFSQDNCAGCKEKFSARKRPTDCPHCVRNFHTKCANFMNVKNKTGSTLRVCDLCRLTLADTIAKIEVIEVTEKSRKNSESSTTSTLDSLTASSLSTNSRPITPLDITSSGNSTSGILSLPSTSDLRFDQMMNMLQGLTSELKAFRADVDTSNKNMEVRLKPLEIIPTLVERMTTVEDKVSTLEEEQRSIREMISNNNNVAASMSSVDQAALEKINELEQLKDQLSNKISSLEKQRYVPPSSDLVISGLCYGNAPKVDKIALAVLRAVRPSITENDIVSARVLRRRNLNSQTAVVTNGLSAANLNNTLVTEPPLPSSGAIRRHSTNPIQSNQAHYPIAVTLTSAAMAKSIILSKMKMKKLPSSSLNDELLLEAGCALPLQSSFININELLDSETWRLKREILEKSQIEGKKFFTFTRNGCIFVKKKKEDNPTAIKSKEDLNLFLLTL